MKDIKKEIQRIEDLIKSCNEKLDYLKSTCNDNRPEITREIGKLSYVDAKWSLDAMGRIEPYSGCGTLDFYNAFPTLEAAESEAKYTKISREYRAFAKAVNDGWLADLKNDNYGIMHSSAGLWVSSFQGNNPFIHQVSFRTRELAEKALELFGNDLLILAKP